MRNGKISRSSTLISVRRCAIARYENPKGRGLPTLGTGLMLTCYQSDGIIDNCVESSKGSSKLCADANFVVWPRLISTSLLNRTHVAICQTRYIRV